MRPHQSSCVGCYRPWGSSGHYEAGRRGASRGAAEAFLAAILAAVDAGDCIVVHVSANQFRTAWELRQKLDDKRDTSFVDFTSIVVMQDLGITNIFTGDSDFRQVNLGFQLFP